MLLQSTVSMTSFKKKYRIQIKILELTRNLKGTTGSKAHGLRKQIEILNWVLE